jgi:hypothetical protein
MSAQAVIGNYSRIAWQRELLHAAMAFMESAWYIPLFIAFVPGASLLSIPQVVVIVLANVLGAMGLVRFLALRWVRYEISRWIVLAGIVTACVVMLYVVLPTATIGGTVPLIVSSFSRGVPVFLVPPPAVTIVLIVFLWYRGIRLATLLITPVRASFGFRAGILIMALLGLVPSRALQSEMVMLLPLFFFAGLMATTLARAASLRINRDLQRATFGGHWLGLTGIIGATITGFGFLIALLLAGYGVEGAGRILKGLLSAMFAVFVVVATPILYVLEWLLRPLAEAFQRAIARLNMWQAPNPINQMPAGGDAAQQNLQQITLILNVLKFAALGIIVLAVVIVLFNMLRNRALGLSGIEREDHEKLNDESLIDNLRALLRRSAVNLQNVWAALAQFGLSRDLLSALTIRRLYARLLARAAELGYPRHLAQTPYEYQKQLRVAFPGFLSEIETVTRAYVNAHYGELPDSPEALAAMQSAVDRMIASVTKERPG